MDRSEPTLRVATPADAKLVEALMKESAAGLFPRFYSPDQVASGIRYVAHIDPMLLADGTYYALESDGELVACGGWSRRARPYAGSGESADDDRLLDPATEAANIRAMFVRPDWTRRGLGRRIIEASEAAALSEGFRRLALVATLSGVPLYLAAGFKPVGEQFSITLEDGVEMECLSMDKSIETGVPGPLA
jgi:GNAT superfamily N-acetyltransferase